MEKEHQKQIHRRKTKDKSKKGGKQKSWQKSKTMSLFSGCVSCDLCICMSNHRLFPLMLVIFKTFLYFSICDRVRPLMLLLCWRWYCRNLPYVALELNVMVQFFFFFTNLNSICLYLSLMLFNTFGIFLMWFFFLTNPKLSLRNMKFTN